MGNRILYFPFIDVPDSTWFTRMLLYWDEIGSIIPDEYTKNPEMHDEYTRSLLKEGLLTPVIPGYQLGNVENFEDPFIGYLVSLGKIVDGRRTSFEENNHVPFIWKN